MSERSVGLQGWLSAIRQLLHLLLLLIAIVLVVSNWSSVNSFVKRLLHSAIHVAIPDLLTVSITSEEGTVHHEKWAAFYRVGGSVRILEASLDGRESGAEFLDVEAVAPLNLGGAYVGDAKQMLFLGDADIRLKEGEALRIYTFAREAPKPEPGRRVVIARPLKTGKAEKGAGAKAKNKEGIFKAGLGEGDRITLIDRDQKVILDLDYWWIKSPASTANR
jgi:hypothetical protein